MKKSFFVIVLLLKYCLLISQVGFQQNIVIDKSYGVSNPNETVIADVDNDGFLDIIVAGDKISWFKNINGTGDYSTGKNVASANSSYKNIAAGDMDGDNDIDIVFSYWGYNDQIFAWCKNLDGQGNFGAPISITTSGYYDNNEIQIIDIDADADKDIVVSSGNFISWFENTNGTGTFTERMIAGSHSSSSTTVKKFFAKSIDNEPRAEVMAVVNGSLRCYRINTDYTTTIIDNVTGSPFTDTITAADIDNDGDEDIVISYNNGPTRILQCFKNTNGLGAFGTAQNMVTLPSNMSTTADGNNEKRAIEIIDLDHDNKLDIVQIDSNIANANWYKNMGNGVFTIQQLLTTTNQSLRDVKVVDANNDGHNDILITTMYDDKVSWYKNTTGNGTFAVEKKVYYIAESPNSIDYGDIDNDGDLDLLSSSSSDNKLAWYKNVDGLGTFSDRQKLITDNFVFASNAMLGDMDNDGDLDAVGFSWYQNSGNFSTIAWFENSDGGGNFIQKHIIVSNTEQILKLNLVDVDNDNDLDVVCGSAYNVISLYRNNGNGTFASQSVLLTSSNLSLLDMITADFDNDNDMDVAISCSNNEIAWYENVNGQGNFTTKHVIVASMYQPMSIFATDLDGDNDKDLVFCNRAQNQLGYFKNLGAGNFSSQILISIPGLIHPSICSTQDVDNDGDQDLFFDNETGSKLMCILNDGSGNFSNPFEVYATNYDTAYYQNIPSLCSADINADGKLDFVLAERNANNKIAWFKNLGEFKNKIKGNIKIDSDNNGCNTLDYNVSNALVSTQSGTNSFSTFSDMSGNYELLTGQGQFVTSMISPEQNYSASPASYVSNFNSTNNIEINDFCLEPNQLFNDLKIVVYPLTEARPGFNSKYKIVIKNVGTTVVNADVDFNYNNLKFNYINSNVALNAQSTNSLNYLINNLVPFQTKEIEITLQVKTIPNVTIGEVIQFTSSLNNVASDVNSIDNQFVLQQTIVGSYDPNDIQVLEGSQILISNSDEYLHYIIRFQNTGNSYAKRVIVSNVLSDKLDWNTMQLESYSHKNKVEITNGNNVNFIFDAIYLPSSTNDYNKSQGYISYKIKPKSNVVVGDVLSNNAEIYFDNNPAINTNTVNTEIVSMLAVDSQEYLENSIRIYPNPTNGLVKIDSKFDIKAIEVYNALGWLVSNSADLSNCTVGIYYIKVVTENGAVLRKLIKIN